MILTSSNNDVNLVTGSPRECRSRPPRPTDATGGPSREHAVQLTPVLRAEAADLRAALGSFAHRRPLADDQY